MHITLSSFGGIIPRLSDHSLAPTQATMAHDALLRNGRLEAWREKLPLYDTVENARSFHMHGCCMMSWADRVMAADLNPDHLSFYITGREGHGLEVVELSNYRSCQPVYYYAGVPAPMYPPVASAPEQCSREADARAYVYTYVNARMEESAPSPASNIVRVEDGSPVTVSGIVNPPAGYGIDRVHIYRAATGFRPADGKVQKKLTAFLFVASIPAGQATFVDTVEAAYLGAALETQDDRMPPDRMQGVVSIRDSIRLAGWRNNKVFLSEVFQPHNWPAKYDMTLDHNIIHMGEQDFKLYVTTDGSPYIIDVSSCDDTKCTPVISIDTPLPDIGCRYANAAVMTRHGFIYASTMGLVLLTGTGAWHVITKKWFGERDWQRIKPDTIRMAYWEGFLFFVTDMATFMLDIDSDPFGDMKGAELVTLSDKPVACITSNTGKLLLLEDDKVWGWDSAAQYRPYIWRSRPLTAGGDAVGQNSLDNAGPARGAAWAPVSCKVGGGPVDVRIKNPHDTVMLDRMVREEKPVRIRRGGRHLWYTVTLRGVEPVHFIDIGTAHFTVNDGR